ncbi:MAG: TIGR04222 domain-containing membrane protein [Planctomycetota bacterium]
MTHANNGNQRVSAGEQPQAGLATAGASDTAGLWRRLSAFELDDPAASLSFSRRLARENGWSHPFAARVVDEYKRFVYLAMTAGHEVTPSDEVDQAWHLHLTYTRSYWGEMCGGVLGQPLHHGPTKGGQAEGARFEDQYQRTLDSYRHAFGEAPPADIWPPAERRFGDAAHFVRVNRRSTWLIDKPWRAVSGRAFALAAPMIVVLPPVAAGAAWNPLDYNGAEFLSFYAVLCVLAIIAAMVCRYALRAPDQLPVDAPLPDNPEEIAALRGGWQAAFQSAMAGLLVDGAIEIKKRSVLSSKHDVLINRQPTEGDTQLQQTLLTLHNEKAQLDELGRAAEPLGKHAVEQLERRGLLETPESFRAATTAVLAVMGAVGGLGVLKLMVGLARDKPVGFLLIGLFVFGVIAVLLCRRPFRTRAGERVLTKLKLRQVGLRQRVKSKVDGLEPSDAALAVGLYGVAECATPELDPLRKAVASTPANSGGCGGSADDGGGGGGGGCGGGCGGCGGCGG